VVEVHADVVGRGAVEATLTCRDGRTFEMRDGRIEVDAPERWWPVGHGEPVLHELRVRLVDAGEVVDERVERVGLRTVTLESMEDDADWLANVPMEGLGVGARMRLLINGEPVYLKGANWIPDDCFPHRVTRDRIRRRLGQARWANMNMIRVWGGGVFESRHFYEACDELGLLVWQDFLHACATYPEDEGTRSEVEAEARDNLARLAPHASLVFLNGCNENLWGHNDWWYEGQRWPDALAGRGWGDRYYFETYPAIVDELVGDRAYWPGSPASGPGRADFEARPANNNEHGNRHIWNVWHGPGHYLHYLEHFPRLSSEFGFHGPACWATVERSTPPDQRRWDSPVMRLHNKNGLDNKVGDGQDKSTLRMSEDFVVPGDFDDWLFLSQVMQARALAVGVGWFRALFPWNQGALYWQLNDCWPCASWSAIDGDGRAKPLLHASRRFFAPRVVNLFPRRPSELGGWEDRPGPLRAYLHNDAGDAWTCSLRLRLMTYAGETLGELSRDVRVGARSAGQVDVPDAWTPRHDAFVVADATDGGRQGRPDAGAGVRRHQRRPIRDGDGPLARPRPLRVPGPPAPRRHGRRRVRHAVAGRVDIDRDRVPGAAGRGRADAAAGAALHRRPRRRRAAGCPHRLGGEWRGPDVASRQTLAGSLSMPAILSTSCSMSKGLRTNSSAPASRSSSTSLWSTAPLMMMTRVSASSGFWRMEAQTALPLMSGRR